VVVCDLDVIGISILPNEADAILVVDPNAVLPPTIAAEPLKPIARRNGKLPKPTNPVQLIEPSPRDRPQYGRAD